MENEYRGPESIYWATFPNRGRSYHMNVEGHEVQISVSEKAKRVRVFVDGEELR